MAAQRQGSRLPVQHLGKSHDLLQPPFPCLSNEAIRPPWRPLEGLPARVFSRPRSSSWRGPVRPRLALSQRPLPFFPGPRGTRARVCLRGSRSRVAGQGEGVLARPVWTGRSSCPRHRASAQSGSDRHKHASTGCRP